MHAASRSVRRSVRRCVPAARPVRPSVSRIDEMCHPRLFVRFLMSVIDHMHQPTDVLCCLRHDFFVRSLFTDASINRFTSGRGCVRAVYGPYSFAISITNECVRDVNTEARSFVPTCVRTYVSTNRGVIDRSIASVVKLTDHTVRSSILFVRSFVSGHQRTPAPPSFVGFI